MPTGQMIITTNKQEEITELNNNDKRFRSICVHVQTRTYSEANVLPLRSNLDSFFNVFLRDFFHFLFKR